MKQSVLIALFVVLPLSVFAETLRVLSPNRLTWLEVTVENGRAAYAAGYRKAVKGDTTDVALLRPSPLGLQSNLGDWSQHLVFKSAKRSVVERSYELRQGKKRHIHYAANTLAVTLEAEKKHLFDIEFEVSDNNIAFRYRIPAQGQTRAMVVTGEATGFKLNPNATAFITPQSDAMIGWRRTKPSYEEHYVWDAPLATRSQYGQGWTFPCLFRQGSEGWVLISETGTTGNYVGCHLNDATTDALFTIAFPMAGENNGFGSTSAQLALMPNNVSPNAERAGCTPWRTITLAPTLKPIIETTVMWDVLTPLYEPKADYRGMRNTWSWIIWQDNSLNYKDQVAYIDLAAQLGWEGCLIDGLWYENMGRKQMEQLLAYARQKGVKPWVWYNSNGGWNDAPQSPSGCMDGPIQRKREMQWLQQQGVAGIKVDFFAGDKQETMRLYEAILSDANDYGLQVIFHGCTLPRGWERLYPNYCGSEAVLASENLVFSQQFCDLEARHATLHPFVRNAVGAMEYGGTVLQKRLNREGNGGNTRRTSDVFELATAIAFQCSGQNFALTPLDLAKQPAFEIDFMRDVPTTWDDTRFIDGYPGKHLTLARQSSAETKKPNTWYVVSFNAETRPRKQTIYMPEFANQRKTYLWDGKDGKTPTQSVLAFDKRGRATVTIQPQCAVVIF